MWHYSSQHSLQPPPQLTPALPHLSLIHVCIKRSSKADINDHIPSLYCCLPTHDQSVGSILREMPTSTAAAPPLPTWLLCTHTHTHTHTHKTRLKWAETKEIRCCWQPQSHHLRKRHWSCLYDVRGGSVVIWWRPQHGENRLFILD